MNDIASREEPTFPPAAHATKGRILLADDEELFRETLARLLRRNGYEVLLAADAESALELLRRELVEVLIADIYMPGNADLELIQSVPQVIRGLPIIVITGLPAFETAVKSIRLSVSAYLVKPPNIKELLNVIEQNIARYRSLQTVAASREKIEDWARELSVLEESLRRPSPDLHEHSDYLRLTLRNMALQLAELAQSTICAAELNDSAVNLEKLELINALRDTVSTLEKTRQNFKSKELGDLRRRLSALLPEHV